MACRYSLEILTEIYNEMQGFVDSGDNARLRLALSGLILAFQADLQCLQNADEDGYSNPESPLS